MNDMNEIEETNLQSYPTSSENKLVGLTFEYMFINELNELQTDFAKSTQDPSNIYKHWKYFADATIEEQGNIHLLELKSHREHDSESSTLQTIKKIFKHGEKETRKHNINRGLLWQYFKGVGAKASLSNKDTKFLCIIGCYKTNSLQHLEAIQTDYKQAWENYTHYKMFWCNSINDGVYWAKIRAGFFWDLLSEEKAIDKALSKITRLWDRNISDVGHADYYRLPELCGLGVTPARLEELRWLAEPKPTNTNERLTAGLGFTSALSEDKPIQAQTIQEQTKGLDTNGCIIEDKLFYKGREIRLPQEIYYPKGSTGKELVTLFDKGTFGTIAIGIINNEHFAEINKKLNKGSHWFQTNVWQQMHAEKYKEYRDWAIDLIHKYEYSWVSEPGQRKIDNYLKDKAIGKKLTPRKNKISIDWERPVKPVTTMAELQTALQGLNAEKDKLLKEKASVKSQLKHTEKDRSLLELINANLKSDIIQLTSENEHLEDKIEKLTTSLEMLKQMNPHTDFQAQIDLSYKQNLRYERMIDILLKQVST